MFSAMTKEQILELKGDDSLADLYNGFAGELRPLLYELPGLAEPIARDLTVVIVTAIDTVTQVARSQKFQRSALEMIRVRAKLRRETLTIYENAGFSPSQAFQLLMADVSKPSPTFKMPTSPARNSTDD